MVSLSARICEIISHKDCVSYLETIHIPFRDSTFVEAKKADNRVSYSRGGLPLGVDMKSESFACSLVLQRGCSRCGD